MNLEDVYVAITATEKAKSITTFIDKYLKGFKEEVDYYEYPPFFGETEFETENYEEMLSFVLKGDNKSFRFYFENKETPKGMIFVNKDGSVFLGLGVPSEYSSKYENKFKNSFLLKSGEINKAFILMGNTVMIIKLK